MFIRASRETHSGELVLVVRPNVYIGDDATDPEPDFVYNPDTHDITTALPPGSDPLSGSIMLLSESLESGAALAQFEVRMSLHVFITLLNEHDLDPRVGSSQTTGKVWFNPARWSKGYPCLA